MRQSEMLFLAGVLLQTITADVHAGIEVFACEPEWAALIEELGGAHVKASSATTTLQDVHHIQARGIIFIDLAIAQIAGLGVIAAYTFGWDAGDWTVQVTAFSSALIGALILYWCERRWPEVQDAVIGTAFILAASAGILMLAGDPHAGEHLKELMVGQILWIDYQRLPAVAGLYALVLLLWFGVVRDRQQLLFYLLFALTVTASVQLVGVYLVFASLIIPALTVCKAGNNRLWIAYGLRATGYALGLISSALFDMPAGAVIVLTLVLLSILLRMITYAAKRG